MTGTRPKIKTISMDPKTHRAMAIIAAQRDTTIKQLIDDAFAAWKREQKSLKEHNDHHAEAAAEQ